MQSATATQSLQAGKVQNALQERLTTDAKRTTYDCVERMTIFFDLLKGLCATFQLGLLLLLLKVSIPMASHIRLWLELGFSSGESKPNAPERHSGGPVETEGSVPRPQNINIRTETVVPGLR